MRTLGLGLGAHLYIYISVRVCVAGERCMYAQLMLYVYVCVPANSYVSTHVFGGACDVPITRMYVWADGCIRLYTGTRGPGN